MYAGMASTFTGLNEAGTCRAVREGCRKSYDISIPEGERVALASQPHRRVKQSAGRYRKGDYESLYRKLDTLSIAV